MVLLVLLVLLVPLVPLVHVPRAGARVTRPSVLGHRLAPVLCPASVASCQRDLPNVDRS